MAEDIKDPIAELGTNIESVVKKAQALETELKASQKEVSETKSVVETTKAEIKSLQDAAVKRDESDKKNQEALDKLIARNNEIRIGKPEAKSFDQVLAEKMQENEDNIAKMSRKELKSFSIDLNKADLNFEAKAVGDMAIANYTGGTRGLTQLRDGIIMNPNRKVHVRDLLPIGQAGPGTEFVFMKENGVGEGAIASVSEGSTKPQFDLDLIEASVPFETIAGWLRVTRKAMNNIKGFTSFLQARLPELLLGVEDNLLLNGTGVSPQIKGIQVAGNFTAASGAGTINIEQLVQAISQLEELNREATGIVVRPSDYYAMLLNKSAGSLEYDLPNIITVDTLGTLRILGIPVARTTAQTVDKFLVGDFRMGAQLLIQEAMRIEFFEQDGDNVRTNKITVRIEETVAFPVYGSDYFIFGDFGDV